MPRRFRFRLQPLLRIREQAEDFRKRRLGDVVAKREAMLRGLRRMQHEEAQAVAQMHDAKTGAVNLPQLRLLNRFLAGLSVTRRQHESDLGALEGEIERRRAELIHAARDKQVVAKFRSRKLEQHRRKEAREEQAELDEAAQNQSRRAAKKG